MNNKKVDNDKLIHSEPSHKISTYAEQYLNNELKKSEKVLDTLKNYEGRFGMNDKFEYHYCHCTGERDVKTYFKKELSDGWIHIGTVADPTKLGIDYALPTDFIYFFVKCRA